MNNKQCSPDYIIEPREGILQYCPQHENAERIAEALRGIAEARSYTVVLIKSVCENHKDPVQKWKDVMDRARGHHTMGDSLGDIFEEMYETRTVSNIIPFKK